MTFPFPVFMPDAGTVVDLTSTATPAINVTSGTSFTFSAQALGAEAADRIVIVTVATHKVSGTPAYTSVTVGGNACTQRVTVNGTGGSASNVSIWTVALTTGTSADVVVTMADTTNACHVNVWRMTGAGSAVPTATATDNSGALSQSLTIPANGGAVGVAGEMNGGSGTFTWTGLTESSDVTYSGNGQITHAGGDLDSATAASGTIEVAYTGSLANHGMALAAWGP